MELKLVQVTQVFQCINLLIVPYGIETLLDSCLYIAAALF